MLRRTEIINRLSQKGGRCTNAVRRPSFYLFFTSIAWYGSSSTSANQTEVPSGV